MTIIKKAIYSFSISIFLCAIAALLSFLGIFNLTEKRFAYQEAIKNITQQTKHEGRMINELLSRLQNVFSGILHNPAVRNSFLPKQNSDYIYERSKIFSVLHETYPYLLSVRFVDLNGKNIHYSTSAQDIIYSDSTSISYRNYNEDSLDLSFNEIWIPENEQAKIIPGKLNEKLIFSFPFFDSFDTYRGIAVFTVSLNIISDVLCAAGITGEQLTFNRSPLGIISGVPAFSGVKILALISFLWKDKPEEITYLESENSSLVFISDTTNQNFYFGRLFSEPSIILPSGKKDFLFVTMFFSIFLMAFFFLNIRQNKVVFNKENQNLFKTISPEELNVKGLSDAASSISGTFNNISPSEADLEDILKKPENPAAILTQPFSLSQENPELLTEAEDIIYERDGIHYINSDSLSNNNNETLEGKLINLVDSVVGKK